MVDVTIGELIDGEAIRTNQAKVPFEQDDITFKGTSRPNPTQQRNILNQEQLESELGVNLEVPDDTSLTIVLDNSMTLDKPIKMGLNSILSISASTSSNILTYTGTGALFQNTNSVDTIAELELENLTLVGDDTNDIFDIIGNAMSAVICKDVIFQNFNSMGTIDTGAFDFTSCSMRDINIGLTFKNQRMGRIDRFSLSQPLELGMTAISFIAGVNPMSVTIDTLRAVSLAAGNSLLFIDPNSPAGSTFTITDSDSNAGDFYQQGTDISIISVEDNGSGGTRFITTISHNLVIGKPMVLSVFSESTYNKTDIIIAVSIPLTGITFDVDIPFVANDTGNMNAASLDSTDIRVLAINNINSPDSMFTGESGLEVFDSEVNFVALATNTPTVINSVSWLFSNLEGFVEGVANTGQLVCTDPNTKKYNVSYSGTLEKDTGGTTNIGVVILKNGINVAFNPPHTVNSGKVQVTGTDIVELTAPDTLDIAVINYNAPADVTIFQASLVPSRA